MSLSGIEVVLIFISAEVTNLHLEENMVVCM